MCAKGSVKHSEDCRSALLNAAKALFARHGFEGTSVRDIADKARVNVSAVSYYFDGKEKLYRAVIAEFGRERLRFSERLLTSPKSLDEMKLRLKILFEEIIDVHLREPDLVTIVHREIESNVPVAKEVFEETFLKMFQGCVDYFKAAQKQGLISKEVSAENISQFVHGAIKYVIRMDGVRKRYFGDSIEDKKVVKKTIDDLIEIVFAGIEKKQV